MSCHVVDDAGDPFDGRADRVELHRAKPQKEPVAEILPPLVERMQSPQVDALLMSACDRRLDIIQTLDANGHVQVRRPSAMESAIDACSERSALDPELVREVLETILGLAKEGMTMLCVTHEMGFAKAVADRVVFMEDGEITASAPPAEFFRASQSPRIQSFLSHVMSSV